MIPKISIITVTYNCASIIEQTIQSVLEQTYPNIEYIIIDGLSNDTTIDIIKKYEEKVSYWISERDNGIYSAMNKGLEKATGDWIFFLNAGDSFYSKSVLSNIDFVHYQKDNNIGFIFGHVKQRTLKGIKPVNFESIPFYLNPKDYKGMGFSHQAVFVRTVLAKKVKFDERFKLCADYNMFVTIVKNGYVAKELNDVISIIYGIDGTSQRNRILQFKEVAEICNYSTSKLGYKLKYIRILLSLLRSRTLSLSAYFRK